MASLAQKVWAVLCVFQISGFYSKLGGKWSAVPGYSERKLQDERLEKHPDIVNVFILKYIVVTNLVMNSNPEEDDFVHLAADAHLSDLNSEESSDSVLNQALDYDAADGIIVADVISFLQAVKAIPDQKISELCDELDQEDSGNVSFSFLHELIQGFAKDLRNSFCEESEDEILNQEVENSNTTGNLEGCGGDISAVEPDFGELLLKNKSLAHTNLNLREENTQLRKQIDTNDDEFESQRKKIFSLEKDLKQCHGSMTEVNRLHKDKDEMQGRIHGLEEEILSLQYRNKVIKDEAEDYRCRLSCLQDQYDSLSLLHDQLRKENLNLVRENTEFKASCDSYQATVEAKEEQITVKVKECTELQEKMEEYERTIEDLQEEKEALVIQVKEVQLEYSICQKAVTGSAPGTPAKTSIQHELTQAENGVGLFDYPSPLCGTNYTKQQQNSPLTETLKKGLLSSLLQSPPPATREQERKVSDIQLVASSTQTYASKPTSKDCDSQTDKRAENDNEAQTDPVSTSECITQTDIEEEIKPNRRTRIEEEDRTFEEQSHMIQNTIEEYKEKIMKLEKRNEELEIHLDREKNKAQYLTTQMGASRAKIQDLQALIAKEQQKLVEMTDVNIKLCSGKLDMWYEEHMQKDGTGIESRKQKAFNVSGQKEKAPSQLIDALWLDPVKKLKKHPPCNSNILHGQVISQPLKALQSDPATCKNISIICESDKRSLLGRNSVLSRCKDIIEQAIKYKVETLLEVMRELVYSDDCAVMENIWEKRKLNTAIRDHLSSLQNLSTKLGSVSHCIGAREEEEKQQTAVKSLSKQLAFTDKGLKEARSRIRQLFTLSLECQCFAAVRMLSVLSDIEHGEEDAGEKIKLHSERVKEVVNLSSPLIQTQIQNYQKTFDALEENVLSLVGRNLPSKMWLMMIYFVLFIYLSMQWEDYRVTPVV